MRVTDRWMDRQNYDSQDRASIGASLGKNHKFNKLSYLEDNPLEVAVHSQHIQAEEDNHLVENIHNRVEQGSLVEVEIHQAVLDILSVVVESLAGEDMQDILDLLHTVDIPDTSHTHKL